jgi:hypothetical protein
MARRYVVALDLQQSFVEMSQAENRRLLDFSRPISEPSLVMAIAEGTKQSKTVEVNP